MRKLNCTRKKNLTHTDIHITHTHTHINKYTILESLFLVLFQTIT